MTNQYQELLDAHTAPGALFEFEEMTHTNGVTYREISNPGISLAPGGGEVGGSQRLRRRQRF